jgi:hypothetical protein
LWGNLSGGRRDRVLPLITFYREGLGIFQGTQNNSLLCWGEYYFPVQKKLQEILLAAQALSDIDVTNHDEFKIQRSSAGSTLWYASPVAEVIVSGG